MDAATNMVMSSVVLLPNGDLCAKIKKLHFGLVSSEKFFPAYLLGLHILANSKLEFTWLATLP